ncbi:uncharacterized protein EI90DRAFT_297095 [Cantharellus anzutake]|uniref:uncharacterized protein n=1 Tax=Cantharellus anzutake TaxID=1750568 RepID=UPI001904B79A|nr:uncharacterized protein EI90DRAFT_297095 [Cantharellus anzutake]KAF8315977.1 hypothetical protein EI90DRAFT_297095 [Cantharellus anzutake]
MEMGVQGTKPKASEAHVAHIVSKSLSEDIDCQPESGKAKVGFFRASCLYLLMFNSARVGKEGSGIDRAVWRFFLHLDHRLNSPLNAFTASDTPHKQFDSLDLWLVPALVRFFATFLPLFLGLTCCYLG